MTPTTLPEALERIAELEGALGLAGEPAVIGKLMDALRIRRAEAKLLLALHAAGGKPVPRQGLTRALYGNQQRVSRILGVHIHYLRSGMAWALATRMDRSQRALQMAFIRTVPNFGYALTEIGVTTVDAILAPRIASAA